MLSSPGLLQVRLFWAFVLITAIAVAVPAYVTRTTLYEERLAVAERQALAQAAFAGSLMESHPSEEQVQQLFRTAQTLSQRVTLTDPSGRVLRDSHFGGGDLLHLDNHADRPEIEAARDQGEGTSLRYSNTLRAQTVYAARELQDGNVLRIAVPLADIQRGFEGLIAPMGFAVAAVAALCLLLSWLITGRLRRALDDMAGVVASLATDRAHRRLHSVPGREFLPLAESVNRMADDIEAYVATVRDQQGQLSTILDSMHEGVLVLSPSGMIRRWNRALEALFPAVARSEGRPLIDPIPVPALQRRVDDLLARTGQVEESAALPGSEAVHFEMPVGRFLVAHVSRPVEPNASLGAIVVVYDATEIMRLERVRRDFVSNVSHELCTPLTAIIGYAEVLRGLQDPGPSSHEFADVIHRHATALNKIISDLLALARIEDKREPMPLEPVDLRAALTEAMDACGEQARSKQVSFAVAIEPGLAVYANTPLLVQALRNLLENACRYSPEGDAISIAARRKGREVLVSVADNGPGIPQNELSRIFERFYQVEKQRNSGTSGIGLAICKHIIERHGGRIWAESPWNNAATAMLFTLSPVTPE